MSSGASNVYEPEEIAIAMVRAAGVNFTNAGARGKFAAATGVNGVTRTGAGVYTLTLANDAAAPAASTNLIPTLYGAIQGEISVAHTSDTVKTISTFNSADAATDFDFDLIVRRIAPF